MDNGLIGKIEKAKRYSEERNRIHFDTFSVLFEGENGKHNVGYHNGKWSCDCNFFHSRGMCSHTMAMEKVLVGMVMESSATVDA